MVNNVKVLKFVSGEEVIARIEQKETLIILDNPQKCIEMRLNEGKIQFGLTPWFMGGKNDKVTVSIDHIMAQDVPTDKQEKIYLASVTGLTL